MKRTASIFLIAIASLAISFTSCKKKPKDADIKASVEKILAADPMAAGMTVAVEKGVVTLSGVCKDEMCKASCEKMVTDAKIKGVVKIENKCELAPAPVEIAPVDELTKNVMDAIKSYSGVTATVADGIVTVKGAAKGDRQKIKMAIDGLKPKKTVFVD